MHAGSSATANAYPVLHYFRYASARYALQRNKYRRQQPLFVRVPTQSSQGRSGTEALARAVCPSHDRMVRKGYSALEEVRFPT